MVSKNGSSAPLHPTGETKTIMVHVTAPSTLQGGYTFEAEVNGDPNKVFVCEVPEGGVREGQTFLTPLPLTFDGPRLRAPIGVWKDGLFDCFSAGICHASFWCSWCCTQIAMGQLMSRLQLTWLGEPGQYISTMNTFKVVAMLTASFYVYSLCLQLIETEYYDSQAPTAVPIMKFCGNFLFIGWALYSLCRVRQNVRERYQIPEEHCAGCEDLCCSLWCGCCVTAQMLRHTGEYETYPGTCCTGTGHPAGTPITV